MNHAHKLDQAELVAVEGKGLRLCAKGGAEDTGDGQRADVRLQRGGVLEVGGGGVVVVVVVERRSEAQPCSGLGDSEGERACTCRRNDTLLQRADMAHTHTHTYTHSIHIKQAEAKGRGTDRLKGVAALLRREERVEVNAADIHHGRPRPLGL